MKKVSAIAAKEKGKSNQRPLRKQSVKKEPVVPEVQPQVVVPPTSEAEPAAAPGSYDHLKANLKQIDKGKMSEALKRVKAMRQEAWRDPGSVRRLTESIAQDIGLKIDPKRLDAFMNAYTDIAKKAGDKGPKVSVDELAQKYAGAPIDMKTLKEIKKFVK